MPVPDQFAHRHAYHVSHLDNLRYILRHGFLSVNEQARLGLHHRSIASSQIQTRRAITAVTCEPGGVVHDYVPLYLCRRSSMLLSVINSKNCDQQFLVYFAFPMTLFDVERVVFTDAAANTAIPPNFYSDPADLARLSWDCIDSLKWTLGEEGNRHRMAEVLVNGRINPAHCCYLVVWNPYFRDRVIEAYRAGGIEPPPIIFEPKHYFTKYPEFPAESLTTGPFFTKRSYNATYNAILQNSGSAISPKFPSVTDLVHALRSDLSAIPETAELIDLRSSNEMHQEDVGTHTKLVVEKLRGSQEFAALDDGDKQLVELAAYLHDIGKGPKSRWAANGGVQKVDPDHPVKGLSMVRRILCEEVASCEPRSAKILCKLVCYHDLVGDIVAKGRDASQLDDIAENERDLDMLIALAKADMASVNDAWGVENASRIAELRLDVLLKLNASIEGAN